MDPAVDAKLLCACRLAYVDPPPGAERGTLRSDADKDASFPFPFGAEDGKALRRKSPDCPQEWPQEWERWESVGRKDAAILGVCSLGIIVAFRGTLSPIYVPGVGLPEPREHSNVSPEHPRAPLFMQALGALFEFLQGFLPSPLRALLGVLRYILSSKGFFESINDWLNNADLLLTPWREESSRELQVDNGSNESFGERPQVHSGWKESLEDLWHNRECHGLKHGLKRALEKKKQKIFVTGHSKGGALAFLAAMRIQKEFSSSWDDREDAQLCVRTFAAPKPGDKYFAEEYDRTIADTVRYEYGADIVPHLPPRREGTKKVFKILLGTSNLWYWLFFNLGCPISGQPIFPTECDRYCHGGKKVYIPYFTSATLDATCHGEGSRGWAPKVQEQRALRGSRDDPGQHHRGARSTGIEDKDNALWLKTVEEMLSVSPLAFVLIGFDHAFSGKSGYASYIFSKAAAAESAG